MMKIRLSLIIGHVACLATLLILSVLTPVVADSHGQETTP